MLHDQFKFSSANHSHSKPYDTAWQCWNIMKTHFFKSELTLHMFKSFWKDILTKILPLETKTLIRISFNNTGTAYIITGQCKILFVSPALTYLPDIKKLTVFQFIIYWAAFCKFVMENIIHVSLNNTIEEFLV